jgi:hypothetical protein
LDGTRKKSTPLEHDAALPEIIPAERSFASVRRLRLAPLRLSMSSLDALLHERLSSLS